MNNCNNLNIARYTRLVIEADKLSLYLIRKISNTKNATDKTIRVYNKSVQRYRRRSDRLKELLIQSASDKSA